MTNNNFAVVLPSASRDSNGFLKSLLVGDLMDKYPHLTVNGLDAPFKTDIFGREKKGIQYAGARDVITFGTAKDHDVSWFPTYGAEVLAAPVPTYDLNSFSGWSKAVNALEKFAGEKKYKKCASCPFRNRCFNDNEVILRDGTKVAIFDNFVKIGNTIVPRVLNAVTIAKLKPEVRRTVTTIIEISISL